MAYKTCAKEMYVMYKHTHTYTYVFTKTQQKNGSFGVQLEVSFR